MSLKIFDSGSEEEISQLKQFVLQMVVKEEEIADAAEILALKKTGERFSAESTTLSNWKAVQAYVSPGSTEFVSRVQNRWIRFDVSALTQAYVDTTALAVWTKDLSGLYTNAVTQAVTSLQDSSWVSIQIPSGVSYVDPTTASIYVLVNVWYDSSTKTYSTLNPTTTADTTTSSSSYPDGLSSLIRSPQEYVSVRLRIASGEISGSDLIPYQEAVASFETAAYWEDTAEPLYLTHSDGSTKVDSVTGLPVANPDRVRLVPYRGELNDYYRRLVANHSISPFTARTTSQFQILKWSSVAGMSTTDCQRFTQFHSECVAAFQAAFFNRAFTGDTLYYAYCRMFIAWMAMVRYTSMRLQAMVDVDLLSAPEITNSLYSFGIYQFDDIPVAYKRRLVRNINRLLANKGTTQVFKDVLSVFGLSRDVSIWKHFLVKYFPFNRYTLSIGALTTVGQTVEIQLTDSTSISATNTTGVHSDTMNALAADLVNSGKFKSAVFSAGTNTIAVSLARSDSDDVVVPSAVVLRTGTTILGSGTITTAGTDYSLPEVGFNSVNIDFPSIETASASTDISYIQEYNEFVSTDPTWETTKAEARELEFSATQTKYFSMQAALDTVQNGIQLSMMWGILKNSELAGQSNSLQLQGADSLGITRVNMFEAFVAVLILTLWRFGADDLIPHGESGISTIVTGRTDGLAYSGETSLLPFTTTLRTVDEYGSDITSAEITEIVTTNASISADILAELDGSTLSASQYAGGREECLMVSRHEELQKLWDFKFLGKLQTECFGDSVNYIDWLAESNSELADWVRAQDSDGSHVDAVIALTNILEDSIDNDNLSLFAAFGTADVVLNYVQRMIRFFKSYTTDLRELSVFMLIDRATTERLSLMNLISGRAARSLRVEPAAVMRDTISMTSRFKRTDSVTVTTRRQDDGSVVSAPNPIIPPVVQGLNDRVIFSVSE